ncbi:MAG: NAD(P)H-dependent oxidoreductase [Gammaproteobacteria bacterium]|nr:NAD(P)H-dependent oxidoreductase [Gammaproteobacteria bacterium]NNC78410.1 NAD(P)H-dependent oxidoreductase [Woeseiaceae bacterium]
MTGKKTARPKILAFSGSARTSSFNQTLVENAARAAESAGAEVRLINLRDFPMPIMNQDLEREQGQPEHGTRLKELMIEHDGFLIASPEHNSSIPALLKNAFDWASRRVGDEAPLIAYKGKTTALLSASPGRLGGLRGLVHVRAILGNLGAFVLPEQHAVSSANKAFDDDGRLVNDFDIDKVNGIAERLVTTTAALMQTD